MCSVIQCSVWHVLSCNAHATNKLTIFSWVLSKVATVYSLIWMSWLWVCHEFGLQRPTVEVTVSAMPTVHLYTTIHPTSAWALSVPSGPMGHVSRDSPPYATYCTQPTGGLRHLVRSHGRCGVSWAQPCLTVSMDSLAVAYLWDLHSQLQALPCLLTGIKQAKVTVTVTPPVVAGRGVHSGGELFVGGAAVVGRSVARVWQHETQVIESAEEAFQDNPCTVGCVTSREQSSLAVTPVEAVCISN